ncbi:phage tail protein [uncultured Arsenicicoccus sp.]|uniref:phage tail protein n=1 Tax=uncultured Arsenicicoccus sp. TaxID=491339 RepID=UPI002597530A|nr:phage tail protein [uncultured Arsenicicoccus sp.]
MALSGPEDASTVTRRVYDTLPDLYPDADAEQTPPWPLLRYLSLIGDQLDEVTALLDRVDARGVDEGGDGTDTSALFDPAKADAAWLPWLVTMTGAEAWDGMTDADRRATIAASVDGRRVGTRPRIADRARSVLTDPNASVRVTTSQASPWDIVIATSSNATPDPAAVLRAAEDQRPAGTRYVWEAYKATWGDVEARARTWGAVKAVGSWGALENLPPLA